MKNWNRFFKTSSLMGVGFAMLVFCSFTFGAHAQGRIAAYTIQTDFDGAGEWNDLMYSDNSEYISDQLSYGSNTYATLPFDFKYDNVTESNGTQLIVGPSWLSFGSQPFYQYYGGLASSSYPGVFDFFGGEYNMAGSGENNFPGYDPTGYYGIYTELDGEAPNRVFTIQWTGVHSGFGTGMAQEGNGPSGEYVCSMQVKLFEGSNLIQFFYQNHDQFLGVYAAYGPYYASSIGLNGFTSPSFSSLTYQNDIAYTPSTDIQFTPPAPPQELSLQPKSLNFGTTTPQNPITMCVTASSTGGPGSTLHVTGYSLTGASAYSVVSAPANGTAIPVGGSVQYCIQFLPFTNGVLTGTFTLTTDGVDSGTQKVNLGGIGAVPDVSYSSKTMFRGVDVELTHTSSPQYLYVNSIGGGPLTVNNVYFIGLDANSYTVSHLPPGPIPPGGVDSIGVTFSPTIEGLPDAHMVINTTAANIPSDTVLMFGVGILPHLAITSPNATTSYPNPLKVTFDSVKIGADSCIAIILSNPGSDTVAIEKNYFSSADVDFSLTPLTAPDTLIPPGGTQSIQVCFTPVQRGVRVATLHIVTDIPHTETIPQRDTSQFDVAISGEGVPVGQLYISGPSTNGSVAVGKSACVTDTFWNTGGGPLTVTAVTIGGVNASVFAASYPALPFVLQANSSQTFTVCATPSDTGAQPALLTGTANGGEGITSASLPLNVYGTSIADTVVIITPFPELTCMPGSDTATITVTNNGNIPTPYNVSVSGANASDFTIVPPATSPSESAGGVATFKVVYNPSAPGASNANFNVTGGNGGSVALNATGGAAIINGSGTASLTTVGFTSKFTATVMNTGTCDWTPGTVTVQPPFAYVSGGNAVIPSTGTGTLNFTFTPTSAGPATQQTVAFSNSIGVSVPAANVVINGTATTEDVKMVSESNGYSLDQNYPNPFNGESSLEMTLPASGLVRMSIMDIQGNVVENVLNQQFDAGTYSVTVNSDGLASGTYYCQMVAGGVTLMRQMTIVK